MSKKCAQCTAEAIDSCSECDDDLCGDCCMLGLDGSICEGCLGDIETLSKENKMDNGIGWAVKQMRNGQKVSRTGWNGPGQYLELQVPDENSKMTLPYIYISTVQGDLVPWLASQTDLLAMDWFVT